MADIVDINEYKARIEQEQIKNELAEIQEEYRENQEAKELYEKGKSFGHPSYKKYGMLFFLAGASDLIKWLELTGVGYIITLLVVGGCFLISIIICRLTNTKVKEAQSYTKELQNKVRSFSKNTVRAARWGKFLMGEKKFAAKIAGNPAVKVIVGEGLDLIPLVNLLNLSVVWVYIAYRQEKKIYQHANESADTIAEAVQAA